VAAKPVSTAIGAPPPLETIAVDEQLGKRIPLDLELTDHAGNAVRLSQYFDGKKPVLMVLAYSSCTMLCSLVLGGLADGLRDLSQPPEDTYRRPPGDTYRVISVSIDPRDRSHEAARMQRVMLDRAAPADSSATWPFLVGSETAIRALADSLGFRYSWDARTKQYAHPSVVFVLAPDGTIVRYLHGVGFPGLTLESALVDAAAGHISTSEAEPGGLLRCFRFDAVLRMYGTYIDILFKGGALLIFVGVLAGGVLLWRRERSRRERGMP
jgi:protein SCO1/2